MAGKIGRAAYIGANVPHSMWVYSVLFGCHVINLVPNSGVLTDVVNSYVFQAFADCDAHLKSKQEKEVGTEAQLVE